MTARDNNGKRCGKSSGSVMLAALVSVVIASMLAVAAAAMLRAQLARASQLEAKSRATREAVSRIAAFAEEAILCDSNSFDSVDERWRNPGKEENETAILVPEFPDIDDAACTDEESRIPLNGKTEAPLAALMAAMTGKPQSWCENAAAEIAALRPLPRREFAMLAPSIGQEEYRAIAPYVTAAPTDTVNINTASRQVLEAMFAVAGRFGTGAPKTLARKLLDFRASGGRLESLDSASVDSALGGLNQEEMEILLAASGFISVKSRHFSGASQCGGTRVVYTIDRDTGGFARIAVR